MDNLIYSVRRIFGEYLISKGCSYYNIPEYQRGYKWTAANVVQLLEDLKNFRKADKDQFYCIQNITITKSKHKDSWCMNVIDGQQRLTTLFILISYLQRTMKDKIIDVSADVLKYSIRENSNVFLREKVLTGILWDADIVPDSAKSKDQYYMMTVANAIKVWFKNNDLSPEIILDVILDDLVLIVNEVNQGDEETVFASLNGGKVDLDGADLVRAILITRAAKQKYPSIISREKLHQVANDDIDLNIDISISSRGKINEFRVKLGVEIDEMNKWWSKRNVRTYFEQLLPNKISKNRSFKYSQHPIDLLYYAFYEAYKEKLTSEAFEALDLRVFENGLDLNGQSGDDHLEFYSAVREFHLTMMDWYDNDEIYNLIGYIMYNFKSNKISFELLWRLWTESPSKKAFIDRLKTIIKKQIAIPFFEASEDGSLTKALTNLRNAIKDTQFDWYNHDFTLHLLPLFDILPIEKEIKSRTKKVLYRVEVPDYFRCFGEDKEHVRSQTRRIDECLSDNIKNHMIEENKKGLNSIGNIVLLVKGVNRSYGNDPHNEKMDRIISEFLINDWYIRPHTFNVFTSKLKSIDKNGSDTQELYWSFEDICRTAEDIDKRLSNYLNFEN